MGGVLEPKKRKRGEPRSITFAEPGWEGDAVKLEYVKSRQMIYAYGWFDSGYAAIPGGSLPLRDFLLRLGIDEAEIRKALRSPVPIDTGRMKESGE